MRRRALAAMVLSIGCLPRSAFAQAWQIEGYGGVCAQNASQGSRTLPAAGAPIATSTPVFPSRQTSSWFFGDGSALLNGVNAEFGAAGRIMPLDPIFSALPGSHAASFGVRLRRTLTARYAIEFSVDSSTSGHAGSSRAAAGVDAATSSFKTAFIDLLTTGPFSAVAVDAAGSSQPGSHRDIAATIAVNARLAAWKSAAPYLTFGGGLTIPTGTLPSATLEGRYRFSVLGEVPIDETDRVSLRYTRATTFVGVAGGGLARDMSKRWGVRLDGRILFGPDTTRVLLDAHPSSVRGAPTGFIESFTNPAIQFSNDPSTGRVSSLGGTALDAVAAFKGGWQMRTIATVGVFARF